MKKIFFAGILYKGKNNDSLNRGAYYYNIQVNGHTQTEKMLLLK